LQELDGAELKTPIVGKYIKLFHRRGEDQVLQDTEDDFKGVEGKINEDQDNDQRIED